MKVMAQGRKLPLLTVYLYFGNASQQCCVVSRCTFPGDSQPMCMSVANLSYIHSAALGIKSTALQKGL